jgi:hypothetical protein
VIWNVKCGCQEGKETLGNALTWKVVEAMGFTCIHHIIQKKEKKKKRRKSNVNAFSIDMNGGVIPLYCSWVPMMHHMVNSLSFGRWAHHTINFINLAYEES